MFARIFSLILALSCFAGPALGAQTLLQINSDPDDFIGAGQQVVFSSDELDFTATRSDDGQVVGFSVNNFARPEPKADEWWFADFAAPAGLQLIPGAYDNATRLPFQDPTVPGLSFSGNGRGCNTLTGRFDVLEAVYDPTTHEVLSFAVDFEQHCEGGSAALFGAIRFNSDVPLPPLLTARIDLQNPLNGEQCVEATGPAGAIISLKGSGTDAVTFDWSTSTGATGSGLDFSFPLGVDDAAVATLTVKDAVGDQLSKSIQVCVSDTTPPTVTILSPTDGATVDTENARLKVAVTDLVDKSIRRYQLFVGDTANQALNKNGQSNIKLFRRIARTSIKTDIRVEAQDASGNVGTASATVFRSSDLGMNF